MNNDKIELPVQGECRCGQVKIEVSAPPLITAACHCTGCQKMTASAFSLTASIPTEAFAVVDGEPIVGGLHGETKHLFCPHCLTWMFTHPEGLDFVVNVRSTMLAGVPWSAPFIEVFTAEKFDWVTTRAVRSYETVPAVNDYQELMAEYAASGRRQK